MGQNAVEPAAAPPVDILGPEMSACSDLEQRFIWAYILNGGNGTQAAIAAGYSNSSRAAGVRAHELLHRERVLKAMHEVAWKTMRGISLVAMVKLQQIVLKDGHPDQLKAITAVLSRTGFSERTVHEMHHSGTVDLNHTDAAIESLRWMKSMSVPREKLLEHFGHSGLPRYEKMLEELDARGGMKVIEAAK